MKVNSKVDRWQDNSQDVQGNAKNTDHSGRI